eukprot:3911361-Ditylum_brightwellii.AAC.1
MTASERVGSLLQLVVMLQDDDIWRKFELAHASATQKYYMFPSSKKKLYPQKQDFDMEKDNGEVDDDFEEDDEEAKEVSEVLIYEASLKMIKTFPYKDEQHFKHTKRFVDSVFSLVAKTPLEAVTVGKNSIKEKKLVEKHVKGYPMTGEH